MNLTLSKAAIIKIRYVATISSVLAVLAMIVFVLAADSTPPAYSLNGTNSTTAGSAVLHYANWTDETALNNTGGYIFSFDNGTGTLVNDTYNYFGEMPVNSSDWRNQLVGYWRFDENTGTTTADLSGNGNTGTLYNGTTICSGSTCPTWTTGKSNYALQFDGSNDYVDAGNSNSLNPTNAITIETWVKS